METVDNVEKPPVTTIEKFLIFSEDVYSPLETKGAEVLVWKKDHKYLLLEEYDSYYVCETEFGQKNGRHIEKGFNRMGTDIGLFDVVI